MYRAAIKIAADNARFAGYARKREPEPEPVTVVPRWKRAANKAIFAAWWINQNRLKALAWGGFFYLGGQFLLMMFELLK